MPQHPLGYEIRTFRTRCQLTFKELAHRVRCSAPYIWKIENGDQAPTTEEFLSRLSIALALSVDEHARLVQAANDSQRVLRLERGLNVDAYRLAHSFCRCLAKLSADDIERIGEILSKTWLREST